MLTDAHPAPDPSDAAGTPDKACPAVSFRGVSLHFGHIRAVDAVDLDIAEGEFFALLGPSGSGKTSCLRLIAGFEQPTAGHITIFGKSAVGVPPYRRHVNTVFQDYALFPHMSVIDNVAYGLKIAGQDRASRRRAAEEMLALVQLPDIGARSPTALSGGQRQRVALARALVNKPRVLLLDEPLGALDLKLREQMQEELKTLQRSIGITFVFVTHDQGEALSMADRVAIFHDGRIRQVGPPEEIYRRPRSPFVADFVGSSNVLPPEFVRQLTGRTRPASLRPEVIRLAPEGQAATVLDHSFLGAATRLAVAMASAAGSARMHVLLRPGDAVPEVGDTVRLAWEPDDLHVMEFEE
ncbi:MAG: ABC transporter ATP-binding protein [Rhodospirillaceae bacterium]|nr:ABC transporter ATP-binding protein [Rhodospirillaceae bacterium]